MKRLLLFLLPVAMISCENDVPALTDAENSVSADQTAVFKINIDGMRDVTCSRSVLTEETVETKITDVTLALYDRSGALVAARYWDSDLSFLEIPFRHGEECSVYALANMGDMTEAFPQYESEVASVGYLLSSYSEIEEMGIPMCGKEKVTFSGGVTVIYLERLLAKVCVRILHTGLYDSSSDALTALNMCNKSIYVRQANRRLMPFSDDGSRAENTADIMEVSDYNPDLTDKTSYDGTLPSGLAYGVGYLQDVSLVLYVPENVQGRLLPGNSDPFGKVYGNLNDINGKPYGDLCTYIEFNASRNGNHGYSGTVMYRYYLGADNTSDFSLERNSVYNLTLDFTEDGFFADSWKVTRGDDWNDNRALRFVEDPYKVTPGGTENIMVHFHRYTSSETSSQPYPERWRYIIDEEAMRNAGLSVSYDPNTMVKGVNGYEDFCIKVTAAGNAVVGSSFPVTVMTTDGSITDHTTVSIVENTSLGVEWLFCPEYVSQSGSFKVGGYDVDDLPLRCSVSDGAAVRCVKIDDDTFNVVAMKTGSASLIVMNNDGSKSAVVDVSVSAPVLVPEKTDFELDPDGRQVSFGYEYQTVTGDALANVDYDVYDAVLAPKVSGCGFFTIDASRTDLNLYVSSFKDGLEDIVAGNVYYPYLVAADCADVEPCRLTVTVKNPFNGMIMRDYGRIDDYTLFSLSDVNAKVRSEFTDEMKANASFVFDGPVPDSDPEYVEAGLVPRWSDGFSYENGVYSLSRNASGGELRLTQKSISNSTKHSAGVHDIMISVRNRHSSEVLSRSCGTLEIYVHAGIGADAEFGRQQCLYSVGGQTFAQVYNSVAGRAVYQYPQSTDYINYIDVTMRWLNPVDGVCVLEKLDDRIDSYDALTFLQPADNDGTVRSGLVFSVCKGMDSRVSVCGEPGGGRAGMGHLLYRALLVQTYDYDLTITDQYKLFFGYESGAASVNNAPSYSVHDSGGNPISPAGTYHFAPSRYPDYRDGNGDGYHVLHFLESVVPATCGWIDLL